MKNSRRTAPAVNASSMADIAFLLLIFFLVTTTIDTDKGIRVKLPPWTYEPIDISVKVKKRNLLSVKINSKNELLVRGEALTVANLKEQTKEFISNPNKTDKFAESADRAIISLQNDRGTEYKTYLAVYNELRAAYNELWDEKAMKDYNQLYVNLSTDKKKKIRSAIPLVISEAEPSDIEI